MTSNSEKRREEHQREKRRCTKYPEGKEAGKKKGFPVEGKKEGSSDKNREQVVSKEVVRRHTQVVKAKKYAFARIPKRYTLSSQRVDDMYRWKTQTYLSLALLCAVSTPVRIEGKE
jgi:hypothetical protein